MTDHNEAVSKIERIFLIGFMGCGKSTAGRKFAAKTDFEFVDLDKVIEEHTGMSIADYFAAHGETAFRELERKILRHTVFPAKSIIATGGGAPCFFDNMQWMNANGTTVYICMAPKALANRLENSKTERPLIKGFDKEQLVDFIAGKLAERDPYYRQAAYILEGTDSTAEKLIETFITG